MTRPYSVLPLPNRLSLLVAWLALPGVSVASLAAAWGTHPQTIYSLMAKGQVPRSRAGLTERLPFMYVYMHYTADFVKEKIFFFKIIFSGALPVGRNSASRIRRRVNAPIPKRSVF